MWPDQKVKVGDRYIGKGEPVYVIAEIGINHNGSLDLAKKLIEGASFAGCDAVKFQKRTPELCVPKEQWHIERDTPWGRMSYIDYRHQTDHNLLRAMKSTNKPLMISTGMSNMEQIRTAVKTIDTDNLLIAHSTSAYPCRVAELNLRMIDTLRCAFSDVPVGYSGHEVGLAPTWAAVALGASFIERHITLDRAMWGSDQAASVEIMGMHYLTRNVRDIEKALGDGIKRVYPSELKVMQKLRRVDPVYLNGNSPNGQFKDVNDEPVPEPSASNPAQFLYGDMMNPDPYHLET